MLTPKHGKLNNIIPYASNERNLIPLVKRPGEVRSSTAIFIISDGSPVLNLLFIPFEPLKTKTMASEHQFKESLCWPGAELERFHSSPFPNINLGSQYQTGTFPGKACRTYRLIA